MFQHPSIPLPERCEQLTPEQELIAVLQANLDQALQLNREYESDLAAAARCMEECERQRVEEIASLTQRLNAIKQQSTQPSSGADIVTPSLESQAPSDRCITTFLESMKARALNRHPNTAMSLRPRSPPPGRLGRNATPPPSSRVLSQRCDASSDATRSQLTGVRKAVYNRVIKHLRRHADDAKDLSAALRALESKVRRRTVTCSNAMDAFAPLTSCADSIARSLDALHVDGLGLLVAECTTEELRCAGIPPPSSATAERSVRAVCTTTPVTRRFSDPGSRNAPKWVMLDGVKLAPAQPRGASGSSTADYSYDVSESSEADR